MGIRDELEPPYPQSRSEVDAYCARFLDSLRLNLGERLVCLLLCGSWARGSALPPESDLDLTVVVDRVDEDVLLALRNAWEQSSIGPANVYGADEIEAMSREAQEMYTTNAEVIWGVNPFSAPNREDFASDLARAAETIARDSRSLLLYPWLTGEEREARLRSLLGKWGLVWGLKNLAAFRSGRFPRSFEELRAALEDAQEEELMTWIGADQVDSNAPWILSRYASEWLREIRRYRESNAG